MSIISALRRHFYETTAPAALVRNFAKIPRDQMREIEEAVRKHYFPNLPKEYLSSPLGENDLHDHVFGRMVEARKFTIPWLDAAMPLRGAKILEIGCGTGSSTAALAEQGAEVTGVDVDEKSLVTARERCRILGLTPRFVLANATEVSKVVPDADFDFIIFYASVEHMTHEERMIALKSTWEMLRPNSLWVITETPNRLWYYDFHTSFLPFFMWLPDELAFSYSQFSQREQFCEIYRDPNPDSMLHFQRRGRGVSFHEFELTMQPAAELDVVSSLAQFHRNKRLLQKLRWHVSGGSRYGNFLAKSAPDLHRGFFEPRLDLIIRKT
jgi:2-polyprenyl-3-methyl-5-hydroxy-6-metoxy-1,4-benzoquinol methylase